METKQYWNAPAKDAQGSSNSVECPCCHFAQEESAHAVSTFCRCCGAHFDIADGKAVAPLRVIYDPRIRSASIALAASTAVEDGMGNPVAKAVSETDLAAAPCNCASRKGRACCRAVECPNCGYPQEVSKSAKSTICPGCSAYMRLEDYHIRSHSREDISTGGDVIVHRRGSLHSRRITCCNLRARGEVSGEIRCRDLAVFSADSQVAGSFQCRRLVIEKRVQVEFLQPVLIESLEIHGRVEGDFVCAGVANVSRKGALAGRLLAKSLAIAAGGALEGSVQVNGAAPAPVAQDAAGEEPPLPF